MMTDMQRGEANEKDKQGNFKIQIEMLEMTKDEERVVMSAWRQTKSERAKS